GTIIHDGFDDNIAYKMSSGEGDIDAAFSSAQHTLKQRILHRRLAPIAMEPRGVLARYFPGEEELTVWSSTQIPHLLRTQLALMIGIPENKLRVITPEVGGGFGSKLNVYAEEALLGWISMQLAKPVKWIEGRRENIQGTIHGRGQVGYVDTGCFTNKMSTDADRGAGRPEATYVVGRAMDLGSAELGMDPAEVRRKNFPA